MIKKILTIELALMFSLFCSILYAKDLTREEYIHKYHKIAIKNMKSYGIPASITLAQACLESSNGNSRLAVRGNNHFGIKCGGSWRGATIRKTDDAHRECFRRYRSAELSFKDHAIFLSSNSRYSSLFSLEQTNYKAWAHGLKAAGYATNPKYAPMLIDIIEKYKLYLYDSNEKNGRRKKSSNIGNVPVVKESIKNNQNNSNRNINSSKNALSKSAYSNIKPLKNSPFYKINPNRALFEINGVTFLRASRIDTYTSLAKEYNLFTKEILAFNDLSREGGIKEGTIVYLERKKRKNRDVGSYIVKSGDTLYKISQIFGVQLKMIFKHNELDGNSVLSIGQEVVLK